MKLHFICIILIFIAGLLVYSNTIYSPFHWDDYPNIVENQALLEPFNFKEIAAYWPTRFFLFWTFALNYSVGGLSVFTYHLANVLIHITAAVFLYLLIFMSFSAGKEKSRDCRRDYSGAAVIAALIFVSHPVATGGVTYIIQRGVSLASALGLLSMLLYLQARDLFLNKRKSFFSFPHILFYGAALVFLSLALLTKEVALVFPFLIIGWESVFGFRPQKSGSLMKYLIPFLIPLLILPILSFLSRGAGPGRDDFFYRINIPWKTLPVLFKDGGDNTLINNPWEYLVTQINGLAVYLRLAFFPVRQNFYYDLPAQKSIFRSGITLSAIICSGLIITGARLLKKNRMEGWGILWFFCGLLPTSSILILWPFLSEYHLYLSLAGFSFFWAGFLIKSKPRGYRRGAGYFLLVILFFFSILAWKRNLIYSSAVLLWGDTARKSPELAPAHSNLSAACIGQGYFDLAVAASRRALELNPEFDGYQNLWAAYRHLGDSEKAEETARKHIERFPKKYEGYYELALVLLDNDDFARAGRTLEKILELNPDSTRIWNDLGRFYQRLRQPEKAREAFLQALEKNRRSVPAHFNLALVYWKDIRDYPQARHHLQEALKFNYNPALEKKIEKALFELDKQK